MKAIILAGGKGPRLMPYSAILPKPLMPIGENAILEIVIKQLKYYGFNEITFAVGHLAHLIRTYFGDGEIIDVSIKYSFEDKALGTAGPLKQIKNLDDTFLVMNGDILTSLDYTKLYNFHKKMNSDATIAIYKRDVKIDFGVIEHNNSILENYIEKPTYSFYVSMGVYIFEPSVLDFIGDGEELDIPHLMLRLKKNNKKVACYSFDGLWLDIGRIDDYEEAQSVFEKNKSKFLKE
ncbi:sugar phosphate nucleotidyltransferase [candidate division KSB1 bacterium]